MITNKDIEQYKHLVYNIVNRYRKSMFEYKNYIDWDEMEQVGMIALYKALKGYDSSKGEFKNYAITVITRAIRQQFDFDKQIETHSDIDMFYNLEDVKQDIDMSVSLSVLKGKLIKVINQLKITPKSKAILLDRLEGMSSLQISKKYNVSTSRVFQIIDEQRNNIKNKLLRSDYDVRTNE